MSSTHPTCVVRVCVCVCCMYMVYVIWRDAETVSCLISLLSQWRRRDSYNNVYLLVSVPTSVSEKRANCFPHSSTLDLMGPTCLEPAIVETFT